MSFYDIDRSRSTGTARLISFLISHPFGSLLKQESLLLQDVPAISSNDSDRDLALEPDSPEPADPLVLHAAFMMEGRKRQMSAFFEIHFPENGLDMVIDYSITNFPGKCFFVIHKSSNCNDLGDRYYNANRVSEDPWPSAQIKKGTVNTFLGQGPSITIDGGNGFRIKKNQSRVAAIYKKVTTKKGRIRDKLLGCVRLGRIVY